MGVGRCHKLCGLGGEITSLAGYMRYTGCLKSGGGEKTVRLLLCPQASGFVPQGDCKSVSLPHECGRPWTGQQGCKAFCC